MVIKLKSMNISGIYLFIYLFIIIIFIFYFWFLNDSHTVMGRKFESKSWKKILPKIYPIFSFSYRKLRSQEEK